MNIVVRTYSGKIVVRPDTSRDHNGDNFYVPDFIDSLEYCPVLFARTCRAGKYIEERFAHRYYDNLSCGILMYPSELMDGSMEGFAQASCLDHSSYLPEPLCGNGAGGTFRLEKNGQAICKFPIADTKLLDKALAEASRICLIRTGDFIVAELEGRSELCRRSEGPVRLQGDYMNKYILDFKIIF